jgi:hypothetical protein
VHLAQPFSQETFHITIEETERNGKSAAQAYKTFLVRK